MSRWQSTSSGLEPKSGGALRVLSGGSITRAAIGTVVGVVAVVLAWHLLTFVLGLALFAVKVAIVVVIIGAIVALLRRIF